MSEPSAERSVWVVDRVEGRFAVLIEDGTGAVLRVERGDLPESAREGDVLRVPLGPAGPDWRQAAADESLTRERLEEARAHLERLRRRDPGGDVKL
jgi:hypothetical protein